MSAQSHRSTRTADDYVRQTAEAARRVRAQAAATDLETEVTATPQGGRVALRGELDMSTFARAREAGREALGHGAVVEVDLGELAFMDSAGVAWLVELRREAEAAGGTAAVVAVGREVRRVLTSLRLDHLLAAA